MTGDSCADCGALQPRWLGSAHRCHAKFQRSKYNREQGWQHTLEPHTAEEFELGYLATGDACYTFQRKYDQR